MESQAKNFFDLPFLTDTAAVFGISRAGLSIVYYADSDWPSLKSFGQYTNVYRISWLVDTTRGHKANIRSLRPHGY